MLPDVKTNNSAPDDSECIYAMQEEALSLIMKMTDTQIYRLLLTIKEVS